MLRFYPRPGWKKDIAKIREILMTMNWQFWQIHLWLLMMREPTCSELQPHVNDFTFNGSTQKRASKKQAKR